MFKHWKEAEKRAAEIRIELADYKKRIDEMSAEARKEETTVERRDDLLEALTEALDEAEKMQAEYDTTVAARNELKAAEEKQLGLLPNLTAERIGSRLKVRDEAEKRADIITTRKYELAWADCVRTGNETVVRNLLNTQVSTDGGVLVPKALVDKIEDVVMKGGQLLNLCGLMHAKGLTEYPVVVSKGDPREYYEDAPMGPGNGLPPIPKDVQFTSAPITPQYITEVLTVTKKFEADAVEVFWEWLMREMPDAARRAIDLEILWGSQATVSGIRGILSNNNALFVKKIIAPTINWNVVNKAMAELDDAVNNVVFVMHPSTFFNNFRGLEGADGHPIFVEMTQNAQVPEYQVGGHKVVTTTKMLPFSSLATSTDPYILAGDFSAMLLNFPDGLAPKITRDPYSRKLFNQVDYLSEIYVGGNIVRPGSFVKVCVN